MMEEDVEKTIIITLDSKEITRESEDEILRRIRKEKGFEMGAICSFYGVTRDTFCSLDGASRKVEYLEYSAYVPLAIKVMRDIGAQALEKKPALSGVGIVHRLGIVRPGECSILVLTASPHRKDAIWALDWIMDTVKEKVPVFKKEVYLDFENGSEAVWKENEEACCAQKHRNTF